MRYTPSFRGKKPEQPKISPQFPTQDVSGEILQLRTLRDHVIKETDKALEKVDNELDKVSEVVETVQETIKEIKSIHKGDKGEDADEQKIADWVLSQIPTPKDGKDADPELVAELALSKLPRPPKKEEIVAEVLKQLPENKASLKIIQEKLEIDKDALFDEFLKSPKLKISMDSVDGLKSAMSVLDRRYIHGGGDTVSAGTNITITTLASGVKQISASGGSGDLTVGTTTITSGTTTRILYDNAGVLGEYTISGSGTVVAMATAPTFGTSITGSYLTASEILITDGSKNIVSAPVATYPSLTELTYLKGVTSAIQTQLNTKLDGNGTATYVPFYSDANTLTSDAHFFYNSTTDVLHVHGLSGDGTDGLLIESDNGTDIGILGAGNTANVTWYGSHNFSVATQDTIAAFTGAGKTLGSLALATYPSLTELSYVKGVTSAIQTQLNAKGDVSKVGTPVNNQIGVWTGDGTLEGDSAFTFDTATDTLLVGTLSVETTGNVVISTADAATPANIDTTAGSATSGNSVGGSINITAGVGNGSAAGGQLNITGGGGGATGSGSPINIYAGDAGGGNGNGGNIILAGGLKAGAGTDGKVGIANQTSGLSAFFDTASLASTDKTFTFPSATGTFVLNDNTATLTNKRITKRTGTTTSSATPTINTDNVDEYYITAQTEAITSFTTNLSGTPTLGQGLFISVIGTAARGITWGASFANGPVALPTTTVTTTQLSTFFKWDGSIWRCYATGSTV